ncbi:MAG: acetoacetate metabolism regulatory protein AtoC [Phycisphaerae bacterium]|nr:MAG: acetoacetate metabolism regulatory protein AtoC [Phycisphaerae bacterium]
MLTPRILIVEDESLIRWSLRQKFEERSCRVTEAENGAEAVEAIESNMFDLIMLDYKLPDTTGLDILRRLKETDGDTVVIMMTAFSNVEHAVEAIKLGAYDYIAKPFQMDELLFTVGKALETTQLRREVRELRHHLQHRYGFDRIIGKHPTMQSMFDTISDVAGSGASTIFLTGETGTGKDLVARIIHYNSDRAPNPFMNITCTALSETLLESELFGHEKGAFTDAKHAKKGLLELADGGTVFLDEVGDMPPALQAKLLRFLEERVFRRVGGTEEISVNVRVISATNRDLDAAVEEGKFRRDLLFRLNVIPIQLPPLRDRGEDICLLVDHFVALFTREFRKNITKVEDSAYKKISAYHWPGNVRELRNACERAVLLGKGETLAPEDMVLGRNNQLGQGDLLANFQLPPDGIDLFVLEEHLLRKALERTKQNQSQAAKLLSLSRDAFRYRLEKHGIT